MEKILPGELILPPRMIFRKGSAAGILQECAVFGERGVFVHGRSLAASGALQRIMAACPELLAVKTYEHQGGEPTLHQLAALLDSAREYRAEWIAGVGGGSIIDMAKACAGLLEAPLAPVAYHDGAAVPPSRIPFVVAPTTAGTGSEATIVCVLTNSETGVKKSFRNPAFMARLVVLDPELLAGSPPDVIAHSGMDAFTQALESYVSTGATWITSQLSLKGLSMIAYSLQNVYRDSRCAESESLLLGSYLAGLALSNARLGVIHGLAHPLGARFHVSHGLACSICLPYAIEFNRDAIGEKYDAMSEAIGGDLLSVVHKLIKVLGIKSPFAGRLVTDKEEIVEETLASGSTAANPRKVSAADVEWFLKRIFQT